MSDTINTKLLVGYIKYIDLETGYWQIAEDDDTYRIKNMPADLKKENLRIAAIVEIIDEMSIYMSGKSVKLIEYKIIN